jgi:nitrate/nitrite transport system ATP-binding protein
VRSKTFTATVTSHDPRNVPTVRPGLGEPTIVSPPRAVEASSAQTIAR